MGAVAIGPTWQREADGRWKTPPHTLGWQVLGWTADYLRQPDGPDAGKPWRYTDEQARFVLWWFAVDERGRFLYRNGMLRRVKGWGKDPVGATLCVVEFVGPCRFDGWDAAGEPVGVAHPASLALMAAVSKDQTRNTTTLYPALISDRAIDEYRIDIGKEITYAHGGRCRLESVTSSPRALEGPRATFTLKNETQHWLRNNEGHAMSEVITRNATKGRDGAARVLAISNAHEPGEDSDAEHDWEAWQKIAQNRSRSTGFLYDSLEAAPELDIEDEAQLRAGLRAARGDSVWLDEDRHVEEIHDTRNSVSTSRRFYLNQIIAAEDAWISPADWDVLAAPGDVEKAATGFSQLPAGTDVTVGLDPSSTDDDTAFMGCRVEDGYVFTIAVWHPADHGGEAPRDLIDAAVHAAFERYNVVGFFSDLHPFESYVDKWAKEFGPSLKVKASGRHPIAWDMRGNLKLNTVEIEWLHTDIVEAAFRHDGNETVRQHFHNARRRPNNWGVAVGKEHRESSRKIDAVPAVMLARLSRRMLGPYKKRTHRADFI